MNKKVLKRKILISEIIVIGTFFMLLLAFVFFNNVILIYPRNNVHIIDRTPGFKWLSNFNLYELVLDKNYREIQRIWKKFSLDYGRRIKIISEVQSLKGRSNGIDQYGNLILKKGHKYQTIYPTSLMRFL